jgi:DNA-binding MarR family transcriptional regulator
MTGAAEKMAVHPLDRSLGYKLRLSGQRIKAGLHRAFLAHGYDLTGEQWTLLSVLWEKEGVSQVDLARRVGKDRHTITRMLEVMEKHGWVRRKADSEDRRCRRVFLTPVGKDLQPVLTPITQEYTDRAFAALNSEELAELERLHQRLLDHLERLEYAGWPGAVE